MQTLPTIALCPPAVRTVAVAVFADPDPDSAEGWHCDTRFLPVLAISARQTADEWVEHEALVISPDPAMGIATATMALDGYGWVYEFATAEWPAEEDAERLAGLVTRLETEAVRQRKWEADRKAPSRN